MTAPQAFPYLPTSREHWSTRVAFLAAGTGIATLAPLIPLIKARLALPDNILGMVLLSGACGALLSMPVAGTLAPRIGCRKLLVTGLCLLAASLVLLMALPPSLVLTVVSLFLLGVGAGTMDCAMNVQAIIVERTSGQRMMSGFHGLYSLGGIIGASLMTALLALGLHPVLATASVSVVLVVTTLLFIPGFLTYGNKSSTSSGFVIPHGIVLLAGCLCFIAFMAEGAILDWGALLMISVHDVAIEYAGISFVAFSVAMTLGRLVGDKITNALGSFRILLLSGILSAGGMLVTALVPSLPLALLGFAMIGAGASNIVPVLFTETGRQRIMPENIALPAVMTLGYTGLLAGPTIIGFVSHATTLPMAFVMMAALMLVIGLCSPLFRTKN